MKVLTMLGVMLLYSLEVDSTRVTEAGPKVNETIMRVSQLPRNSMVYRFDYEFNVKAGGWFKLHKVPATWQEARLRCHSEGAVLASPLTHELMEATIEFAWKNKHHSSTISTASPFWLFTGVHSTFSKGDYTSIEGVPLSRLPVAWEEGEPDNFNNSENCLVIDAGNKGIMADKRCEDVYPYVCYKKEKRLKIENECGTTDPEYKLEASTGSCYKMHHTSLTWARAFQTCVGEGAYLAIPNSVKEARVLGNLGVTNTLIGFHDWGSRGSEWMTVHENGYIMF